MSILGLMKKNKAPPVLCCKERKGGYGQRIPLCKSVRLGEKKPPPWFPVRWVQAGSADKRSCRTQRTLRKWWVGPWWDLPLLAPSVWDLGHQLQGEVEHGIVLGSILSHRSQGMAPEDLAN